MCVYVCTLVCMYVCTPFKHTHTHRLLPTPQDMGLGKTLTCISTIWVMTKQGEAPAPVLSCALYMSCGWVGGWVGGCITCFACMKSTHTHTRTHTHAQEPRASRTRPRPWWCAPPRSSGRQVARTLTHTHIHTHAPADTSPAITTAIANHTTRCSPCIPPVHQPPLNQHLDTTLVPRPLCLCPPPTHAHTHVQHTYTHSGARSSRSGWPSACASTAWSTAASVRSHP
jgi:hypothetical protein